MTRIWDTARRNRAARLERARAVAPGRWVEPGAVTALLEAIVEPGDRVCLEGNNQKQADFLAGALAPGRSGPGPRPPPGPVGAGAARAPGALRARHRAARRLLLLRAAGGAAGAAGRRRPARDRRHPHLPRALRPLLHRPDAAGGAGGGRRPPTGRATSTPAPTPRTPRRSSRPPPSRDGLVVAQVNERVERLPRVDIPAGWVDFVTVAPTASTIEPLFTRDPAQIGEVQVLMAMMVHQGHLRGVRRAAAQPRHRLRHRPPSSCCSPPTARRSGCRGKICGHWALNPHPTLIPAIEAGFVRSVHCFGSELGMEAYVAARPDVFFTGHDGSLRSNRAFSQVAGHYACDLFIGSTLQIDLAGNSSTATRSRITGFGGAPNMGADARGRRHATPGLAQAPGGRPALDRGHAARAQAGGPAPRDLPRAHGAGLRGAARRLGPGRDAWRMENCRR